MNNILSKHRLIIQDPKFNLPLKITISGDSRVNLLRTTLGIITALPKILVDYALKHE